jgi:hypothetical protein
MEKKIHEGETARTGYQVLPEIRAGSDALEVFAVKGTLCHFHEPLVGTHEKSTCATRRVTDCEFTVHPGIRLQALSFLSMRSFLVFHSGSLIICSVFLAGFAPAVNNLKVLPL